MILVANLVLRATSNIRVYQTPHTVPGCVYQAVSPIPQHTCARVVPIPLLKEDAQVVLMHKGTLPWKDLRVVCGLPPASVANADSATQELLTPLWLLVWMKAEIAHG